MAAFPETLSLVAGRLRAEIAPSLGGRVAAFWAQAAERADLLAPIRRDTPLSEALRRGGCYPLAPYSNRVAGASFLWKGRPVALRAHPLSRPHALHGIAWARPFEVVERTATRVRLQLDHEADGDWPWPLRILQAFTLSPDALRLDLAVVNRAAESQPVGLGFHPFFPRRRAAQLRFSARGLWRAGPDLIPLALDPLPDEFDFTHGRTVPEGLDHVFEGVAPRAEIFWPGREGAPGWRLGLAASARLSRAVLFSPPGSDVFCFEPVSHPVDALNAPSRPGLFRLPPGATARVTLKLKAKMIL
jgi:aldose 1-epimerase